MDEVEALVANSFRSYNYVHYPMWLIELARNNNDFSANRQMQVFLFFSLYFLLTRFLFLCGDGW